jgi:hypothetical protein
VLLNLPRCSNGLAQKKNIQNTIYFLLEHPEQLKKILSGRHSTQINNAQVQCDNNVITMTKGSTPV